MAHFQLLVALCVKVKAVYILEELEKLTVDIHVLHHLVAVVQQGDDPGHIGDCVAEHTVQEDLGLELGHVAQLYEQQKQQHGGQPWQELFDQCGINGTTPLQECPGRPNCAGLEPLP